MMKCKHCNGTGKTNMYKDGEFVDCMYCGGTGEVEQTNDEWRKTCSTEEFVEFLYHTEVKGWTASQCGNFSHTREYYVEWLKQPHKPFS